MKLVTTRLVIAKGEFPNSIEWARCVREIEDAIRSVVWPSGSTRFTICPDRGRSRGQGNGVKPIKMAFIQTLGRLGWSVKERSNISRFDAVRSLSDGRKIGLEWETGNISSSHRSVNRILLSHLKKEIIAGVLVLPTRSLYQYLTDRVGNFQELEPYFPVWGAYPWNEGVLAIFAVEQDDTDSSVPRITKGTDGRALL